MVSNQGRSQSLKREQQEVGEKVKGDKGSAVVMDGSTA